MCWLDSGEAADGPDVVSHRGTWFGPWAEKRVVFGNSLGPMRSM